MQSRLSHSPDQDAETFHKDVSKVIRDLEKCFKENTHRACAYKDMVRMLIHFCSTIMCNDKEVSGCIVLMRIL
jgi:hypothetical protein